MNQTFNFGEALSMMLVGETVINEMNRRYKIINNEIICYPVIDSEQSYKVNRLYTDALLSNGWKLYEKSKINEIFN